LSFHSGCFVAVLTAMAKLLKACVILGTLQAVLCVRMEKTDRMSMDAMLNWTRAELVDKLKHGYGTLNSWAHDVDRDGLIWSGTSRAPSFVFNHGFKKPYEGTDLDMGEDAGKWAQHIQDSITKNTRSWGFHFTTNPKVAGQFGVLHAQKAKMQPWDNCDDEYDEECVRGLMKDFQRKFNCPSDHSHIWEKVDCWGKPCLRADKLTDTYFGLEDLCPNWGYAYVVKAEGVHVRVRARDAYGKDYSAEEEVYVPMGVEPDEVLGAIPIYGRKAYDKYLMKNPGLTNFEQNWNGPYGWKGGKMAVPAVHTKDGKGSDNAIGAFIYNPNYKGDAHAEMATELAKKRIAADLGTAIPREAP